MTNQELRALISEEKVNKLYPIVIEHPYDKDRDNLTFNYIHGVQYLELYSIVESIIEDIMDEDYIELNGNTFINYNLHDAIIVSYILKVFTDLEINGDIQLAYTLNAEYNIIESLAATDTTMQTYIEYIYKNVWRILELKKATKTGDTVTEILENIQNVFASFGLKTMKDYNIDLDSFIHEFIEKEQLAALAAVEENKEE